MRDLAIPKALMQAYGHFDCGVYAQVLVGGVVMEGDHLAVEPARQPELPFA
jgi:MOSC domain-containing protein YiiM